MINKNEIIYSINIEDIQKVATSVLERELTNNEINKIKDLIGEKIYWYDAIADTINEFLDNKQKR